LIKKDTAARFLRDVVGLHGQPREKRPENRLNLLFCKNKYFATREKRPEARLKTIFWREKNEFYTM